jgi:hypothetical protein
VNTLPRTKFDDALDIAIKIGVVSWMVRFVFRGNRV